MPSAPRGGARKSKLATGPLADDAPPGETVSSYACDSLVEGGSTRRVGASGGWEPDTSGIGCRHRGQASSCPARRSPNSSSYPHAEHFKPIMGGPKWLHAVRRTIGYFSPIGNAGPKRDVR